MGDAVKTILVVEDNPVVLQTLLLILNRQGFRATGFSSGEEAIKAAAEHAPDVLLCDIQLPDIDGTRVAERVKQKCPRCKILLLSGEIESSESLEEARLRGQEFEVLAKPADPEDLIARISRN